MTLKSIFIVVTFITKFGLWHGRKYDEYSLYNIHPKNISQVEFLQYLYVSSYVDIIFWTSPNSHVVLLLVNRRAIPRIWNMAKAFQIKFNLVYKNVQTAFDEQLRVSESERYLYQYKWQYVRKLPEVYQWLNDTAYKFPNRTRLETIGTSVEKRKIVLMAIKYMGEDKHNKHKHNVVIVEAGAHGHEWLSVTLAMFLIDQLLNGQGPLKDLCYMYHWYILPVLNPDGYVYSQTNDRLWIKNRKNNTKNSFGVNLNRNFNYSFGQFDSSFDPADDFYGGREPFSEPETRALREVVDKITSKQKLMFYFSLHGFGQKILIPYADRMEHLANFNQARLYAKKAASKLYSVTARKYFVGTAFEGLGKYISGDSASWVKSTYKVPFVYTILTRDNHYGHALPKNHTNLACQEATIIIAETIRSALHSTHGSLHALTAAKSFRIAVNTNPLQVFIMLVVFLIINVNN